MLVQVEEIAETDAAAVQDATMKAQDLLKYVKRGAPMDKQVRREFAEQMREWQKIEAELVEEAKVRVQSGKKSSIRDYEGDARKSLNTGVDALDRNEREMQAEWDAFSEVDLDNSKNPMSLVVDFFI